jgi:hypothetical protein
MAQPDRVKPSQQCPRHPQKRAAEAEGSRVGDLSPQPEPLGDVVAGPAEELNADERHDLVRPFSTTVDTRSVAFGAPGVRPRFGRGGGPVDAHSLARVEAVDDVPADERLGLPPVKPTVNRARCVRHSVFSTFPLP